MYIDAQIDRKVTYVKMYGNRFYLFGDHYNLYKIKKRKKAVSSKYPSKRVSIQCAALRSASTSTSRFVPWNRPRINVKRNNAQQNTAAAFVELCKTRLCFVRDRTVFLVPR